MIGVDIPLYPVKGQILLADIDKENISSDKVINHVLFGLESHFYWDRMKLQSKGIPKRPTKKTGEIGKISTTFRTSSTQNGYNASKDKDTAANHEIDPYNLHSKRTTDMQ